MATPEPRHSHGSTARTAGSRQRSLIGTRPTRGDRQIDRCEIDNDGVDLQARKSKLAYNFARVMKTLPKLLTQRTNSTALSGACPERQNRLKPADVDQLVQMYVAGSTAKQIAMALGVNRKPFSCILNAVALITEHAPES